MKFKIRKMIFWVPHNVGDRAWALDRVLWIRCCFPLIDLTTIWITTSRFSGLSGESLRNWTIKYTQIYFNMNTLILITLESRSFKPWRIELSSTVHIQLSQQHSFFTLFTHCVFTLHCVLIHIYFIISLIWIIVIN